jgi:hypothetical protein
MVEIETIKAEIKKLSSQATQAKLDLHDLAEDLPMNWKQIPAVAQRAYDIYQKLESKRTHLRVAGA